MIIASQTESQLTFPSIQRPNFWALKSNPRICVHTKDSSLVLLQGRTGLGKIIALLLVETFHWIANQGLAQGFAVTQRTKQELERQRYYARKNFFWPSLDLFITLSQVIFRLISVLMMAYWHWFVVIFMLYLRCEFTLFFYYIISWMRVFLFAQWTLCCYCILFMLLYQLCYRKNDRQETRELCALTGC